MSKIGFSGFYRVVIRSAMGVIKRELEFCNLIVDEGLDEMATGQRIEVLMDYCYVGLNDTPAAFSDTMNALNATGSTNNQTTTISWENSNQNLLFSRVFHFVPSDNIHSVDLAEIAIGTNTRLLSRTLFKDTGGASTTVKLAPTDSMDIHYDLRMYPPLLDVNSVLTIGADSYDLTDRACNIGGAISLSYSEYRRGIIPIVARATTANALEPKNSAPAFPAGAYNATSYTTDAYVNGSFELTRHFSWDANKINFAGGVCVFVFSASYDYVIECRHQQLYVKQGTPDPVFGTRLPKQAGKELTLSVKTSWGRH